MEMTLSTRRRLSAGLAILLVSLYAPNDVLSSRVAPTRVPSGTSLDLGEPATYDFGDGSGIQLLDLYYPAPGFAGPRPLIVYLHGGGWYGGGRADVRCDPAVPQAIRACIPALQLARGYVVASVDYGLLRVDTRENQFPTQIVDVKLAIKWLRDHAADHRIDPDRVVVFGHSAGGHLAALTALTAGQWEPAPEYRTVVSGFVDLVGPTELESWADWLDHHGQPGMGTLTRALVGCDLSPSPCERLLALASPANPRWLDAADPPGYLACEETDTEVPCAQLWALRDGLVKAHHGQRSAVVIDVYQNPGDPGDDDPHNPDTDVNLTDLQGFLDYITR
jgi:acetyl esterase/lipase